MFLSEVEVVDIVRHAAFGAAGKRGITGQITVPRAIVPGARYSEPGPRRVI
jgi:hypothetical protein